MAMVSLEHSPDFDSGAQGQKTIAVGTSGGIAALTEITVLGTTTVVSSGAVNGEDIINPGNAGVQITFDVSVADGSASTPMDLVFTVQNKDAVSGNYTQITTATTDSFTTSAESKVIIVHPNIPDDTGANFVRSAGVLAPTWRITHTTDGLTSGSSGSTYTFTVGGVYIP